MSIVFFTDRDLGHQFPAILRASGLAVERHTDHFPQDCEDAVWLPEVAKGGWVTLTHDARIRYKPNELAAVIQHKARVLVIVGQAPYAELAHNFVATLTRVIAFLDDNAAPPVIGKVYRPASHESGKASPAAGRVELWYPKPKPR